MDKEIEIANKIKNKYNIDVIIDENRPPHTLYCASKLGKILKIKNIRMATQTLSETEKHKIITADIMGRKQYSTFITYDGLVKIITKSRNTNTVEFAKEIGIDTITKYYVSIETDL